MIRSLGAAAVILALTMPVSAVDVTVSAAPVLRFKGVDVDQRVDGLIFRGGVTLQSQDDTFGGLSGLTLTGANQRVAFVSDRGNFVSGQLAYDQSNRLFGFIGVSIEPMRNSKGEVLPRQFARDAEGVDTVWRDGVPSAVRVGFENLTRVADFAITDGRPGGAAREVAVPEWVSQARTNRSLEAICVAPPASPIGGSTLLLMEDVLDGDGNHRGTILGNRDKGDVSYINSPVVNPTDCKFLPNGDLLVLERGVQLISFVMRLTRVKAEDVQAGNLMGGEVLLSAQGGEIDNMESLLVHQAPNGETRIVIGSDNNFNDWQRTLLLEFALPE